ncbi:unnamed protein product [Danaus chrysippus]|uniref:(African queen) hypothetical protein n=1 Tax=Danaus chrysippus TaxID=151541 RepID=A0A8J2QF45_9NEOP|nr:unnamed protein product [Danaus chrysippus]
MSFDRPESNKQIVISSNFQASFCSCLIQLPNSSLFDTQSSQHPCHIITFAGLCALCVSVRDQFPVSYGGLTASDVTCGHSDSDSAMSRPPVAVGGTCVPDAEPDSAYGPQHHRPPRRILYGKQLER